jgi:PAS domain S-box-containing protein
MKEKGFDRQIFHHAPFACAQHEIIYSHDGHHADYRFIEVNEAFEKLAGQSNDRLAGQLTGELVTNPDEAEFGWLSLYNRISSENGSAQFEHSVGFTDKRFMVNAFQGDDNQLTVVLFELSCQKLPEEPDLLKHGQWQAFWNNDLLGVMIADRNGHYVDVIDEACRVSGFSRDELKGMNLFSMIDPEQEKDARFHFEQIGKNGRAYGEVAYFTKSGEKRWSNVVGTKLSEDYFIAFHEDITQRKRVEQELRKTEQRLRLANKATNDVIWDWDATTDLQQWNESGTLVFGWTEIVERPVSAAWWIDRVHPDDMQRVDESFFAVVENPQSDFWKDEYRFLKADGTYAYVLDRGYVLRGRDGKALRMVGAMLDITASKKAGEELKASEKKYQELSTLLRLLADNMPDMIWAKNLKKDYIFANKALCHDLLNAVDTEEPLGKNDIYFANRERHSKPENPEWHTFGEICRDSDSITIEEMKPMQFDEFGNVRGKFLFLDVHKAPLYDDKGQLIGVVGSARDVTAAKEEMTKSKALAESLKHQTMLRELLMEISSGFINIPLGKVNESVNDALGKMACFVDADRAYTFDYDWENDVCNNIYEWCAEGTNPQLNQLQGLPLGMIPWWIDLHKKGEPVIINDVLSLDTLDGARQILEPQDIKSLLSVPMMNNSQCVGFIGFDYVRKNHTITEAELHLLKIFAQLLTNVKLRKEMVEQFVAAKAKAEESDRLKTHFMNNISHEIRTPLNSIMGFGDLIMDEKLPPEKKRYYHQILQKSSQRLQQTITDIMDIAQLKSGSLRITPGIMDIRRVLTRLTDGIRYTCSGKNILVSHEFPPDNGTTIVKADEEMFSKTLQHLLDNAVKFTPLGRITVGFRRHEGLVECFVKDTGQGISADKLEAVFEPFTQEDVLSTRGHEGSGLGLAIARGLAQLQGGHLWAESKKGEGSTFFFTIPADEAIVGSEAAETSLTALPVSGNPVILIAEDDESSAQLIQVLVQMAGLQTLHVWNGEEAIDFCQRYPEIALVFMDIKMPVMNGLEATARIKELRPALPVVALTAYAQSGDRIRMLEAGCDDYIPKPLSREAVMEKLNKYKKSMVNI